MDKLIGPSTVVLGKTEYGNKTHVEEIVRTGNNISFFIRLESPNSNAEARFRFCCINEARKNQPERLRVITVYFEGLRGIDESIELRNVTDLCLRVERHAQWILEGYSRYQ